MRDFAREVAAGTLPYRGSGRGASSSTTIAGIHNMGTYASLLPGPGAPSGRLPSMGTTPRHARPCGSASYRSSVLMAALLVEPAASAAARAGAPTAAVPSMITSRRLHAVRLHIS
jgi:hypothetical protein